MNSVSSNLRIVAVHGVWNYDPHRSPEQVRTRRSTEWGGHLASQLGTTAGGVDLDFAYYAPHLRKNGKISQGDLADELGDPLAEELFDAWLAEIGAPAPIAQGKLTEKLRNAASWVAQKWSLNGQLTERFIKIFFREVATYLDADNAPSRTAARAEVTDRITSHQPEVVIAHSLGSIVAYEALCAMPPRQVGLFLTLGSPLALPSAIFERLLPEPVGGRGARPTSVDRWVNIADIGDPVAIPPKLSRFFDGIGLDLATTIHDGFGFHNAKNYLSCATTAAVIGPYLGL